MTILFFMKPKELSYKSWVYYNVCFIIQHFFGINTYNKLFNHENLKLKSQQNPKQTKPILFKGLAKNWKAFKKWDFDFFRENYGSSPVLINNTKGIIDPNAPQKEEEIPLRDYINQLQKGSLKYLKLSNLVQKNKNLQKDLDLDWCKKFKTWGGFGETFYMFMGAKNTRTPLHNEFPTTIYIQVKGKKKWILYDVSDRVFLNAKTERRTYFFSDYNPLKPDLNKFPLSEYAKKIEIDLEPGDILIVPPFMWHYIHNTTDSIGVAYKFSSLLNGFKSSTILTILYLLSTRPSIIFSFFITRIKKDDYVLSKKEN